jgi:predicted tellurium resistance membrane protein TerC
MKQTLLKILKKEAKHEWKYALHLTLTFIGATLVGRSVWQWIVDFSNSVVAFLVGLVILVFVVVWQHHYLKKK